MTNGEMDDDDDNDKNNQIGDNSSEVNPQARRQSSHFVVHQNELVFIPVVPAFYAFGLFQPVKYDCNVNPYLCASNEVCDPVVGVCRPIIEV